MLGSLSVPPIQFPLPLTGDISNRPSSFALNNVYYTSIYFFRLGMPLSANGRTRSDTAAPPIVTGRLVIPLIKRPSPPPAMLFLLDT